MVRRFEDLLRKKLGDRLIRIIARSSPDDLVYESNVAVVVDKADLSAARAVSEAALKAMEETRIDGLNPITVSKDEEHEFE